jgi:aminotransferase
MDESAKEIFFDRQGICNFCTDWFIREKQRRIDKQELPWIIYDIKKQGKGEKYDCLLGLSGGVDSSITLVHLLEQGLRPLCFSVDNGWNDPKADENIMRLVEGSKVPFQRFVLDIPRFQELQKAFTKAGVPNAEMPTDHVLAAVTYKMARDNGIKWIIGGGNHATEGIMPKSWGMNARDLTHIRAIFKAMTGKKLKGLPTISLFQYIWYRFVNKVKIVNLLDHYEYDREKVIKILQEKYGYKPYGEKHEESLFTKWFQNFYLPRIHGIDKRKAHYSTLICSGQMTREEALKELEKRQNYPNLYFEIVGKSSHYKFKNSEHHWEILSSVYRKLKWK